ncbi:hypothetical protein Leryth_022578 [Lithospermum erythrorhizon]|nr:hypothetical protein Leryth_022578 [Lithospermum erythrorhizon]
MKIERVIGHGNNRLLQVWGIMVAMMVVGVEPLGIIVNEDECVSEYVLYEEDTIQGHFVVVDHDIFWGSDHPGLDFSVSSSFYPRDRLSPLLDQDTYILRQNIIITYFAIDQMLHFKVTSPGGNIVYDVKGTSGEKFEIKAPLSGMYKFCFHSPYTTPETVSFYIHIGHIPSEHNLAKDEHLDPINVKLAELMEALESVAAEQKFYRAHEARQRRSKAFLPCILEHMNVRVGLDKLITNESTRKRVIFYTIGEYMLLALASGLQVVYIRRLFSKSVGYNRV